MKRLSLYALVFAFLLLFSSLPLCAAEPLLQSVSGGVNGLYVSTTRGSDFPSKPDLSKEELQQELEDIVQFAAQYGFNTIFFEAVSDGGAFYQSSVYSYSAALATSGKSPLDPLQYLIERATQSGLSVVAVVDPFLVSKTGSMPVGKNQAAVKNKACLLSSGGKLYLNPSEQPVQQLLLKASQELSGYSLDGIMLQNFAYPAEDFEVRTTAEEKRLLLTSLLKEVGKRAGDLAVGLMLDGELSESKFDGYADYRGWAEQGLLDFLVPKILPNADSSYEASVLGWFDLAKSADLKVYTANAAYRVLTPLADSTYYGNPQELSLQLYLNAQIGVDGCVIQNYSSIRNNFFDAATNLAASFSPQQEVGSGFSLEFPQSFSVTRPTQELYWQYDTYYIMGTSDPALPVVVDGEEVPQSEHGLWGRLVSLEMGSNHFLVAQGEQQEVVTIVRYTPEASTIQRIQQSTLFPLYEEGVRVGEEFAISCVAPSGAEVYVSLEGETIALSQDAAAEDGIPASFSASAVLTGDYPSDKTTKLGELTYTMQYQGQTTTYHSDGILFAVGENANFAVEVTDMRGDTSAVNYTASFREQMIASVEKGATDYVIGASPSYYQLSCGGYIHKEDVKVLEGEADIDNTVTGSPVFSSDSAGEYYTMKISQKPYYISDYQEDAVIITFYNTSGMPQQFDVSQSRLFSSITTVYQEADNTTTLTMKTRDGKRLWGYNVEFRDDSMVLFGKYTPTLSNNPAKPLEGVRIVVDAGHGGEDPGALGVAGLDGPDEQQLNYMNAAAAAFRLEALGATVYQTQTSHDRLSYEERMDIARDEHVDFYLSFHLNSTGETDDSTNAKGIEIYYNEELSIPLGEAILQEVCASTGRRERGVLFSTFRVTQMTNTPSLLCEMGYMVSPSEYDSLCQPLSIYKLSLGVSNGILRAIREANNA